MMVEVASLGRPLAIFGLPVAHEMRSRLRATLTGLLGGRERRGLASALAHLGHRLGLVGYGRDLTAVHRLLYRRGLAVPVGQPFQAPAGRLEDELAPVVERIRALA